MDDTIITGRKFRVCVNAGTDKWNVLSFWTKAQDVELENGIDVQTFVDDINNQITGILSNTLSDSTSTAPTSKLLKDQIDTLNNNFNECVNAIFNQLSDYGYTPADASYGGIVSAISNMYDGRYQAGRDSIISDPMTTSNFIGAVSDGRYNISATTSGYVRNGYVVHSLAAYNINATVGVNGTFTIPTGYHSVGKVTFSDTPGTGKATTTTVDDIVTIPLDNVGYYDKVEINQRVSFNAGKNAGINETKNIIYSNQRFSVTTKNYTEISTLDLSNYTHLCYRLKCASAVHVYTAYRFFINNTAICKIRNFNSSDYGSIIDADNARGAICTGFLEIPSDFRAPNMTIQIRCINASYGASSFNCDLGMYSLNMDDYQIDPEDFIIDDTTENTEANTETEP